METRRLGRSNVFVNPVGLGCMGFSHAMGEPVAKEQAVRTLREAAEAGYDSSIRRSAIRAYCRMARPRTMRSSWARRSRVSATKSSSRRRWAFTTMKTARSRSTAVRRSSARASKAAYTALARTTSTSTTSTASTEGGAGGRGCHDERAHQGREDPRLGHLGDD